MATVIIPTPLRKFTNDVARLHTTAGNVQGIVEELITQFPDLKKHLLDDQGKIRSFINIFVGDEDIRNLQQEGTAVKEETVVSIVPAIAGGNAVFSPEELARYDRHIIIPGFGMEAQTKLKKSKVLVVGSGGLGSPVLLYLAAAGVGTIGIVDFDVVEDSNLQRQVIFGVDDIGASKALSAKKRLLGLNPNIDVQVHNTQLNSTNALEIIKDYDVVADGTDNFPTRYLVNDACMMLNKPNVYASIFQFEGQLSVFNYRNAKGELGPNYRDLYPTPPPPGLVPSCAEGGVLGVLPGIMGSMQALEVIKVITGIGETMSGRFLIFDALNFETRIFKIQKSPNTSEITKLIDYEMFCGIKPAEKPVKEITVKELYSMQVNGDSFQIIDVREPHEYDIVNIEGELIPLATVSANKDRIDAEKKVIVHCKSGIRSAKAIRELEEKFGFENLYNLKGGILAYIDEIKPELTKY